MHLPHDFKSSCEYIIHYESEDSCAHQMSVPPIMLAIDPKWWTYFEHIIQSLSKTCLCGVCSCIHTEPHTTHPNHCYAGFSHATRLPYLRGLDHP